MPVLHVTVQPGSRNPQKNGGRVQVVTHVPFWHVPDRQSELAKQPCPTGQAGHTPPPQSTPVSLPFFTPSVQVGAAQTPFVQTTLTQSEPLPQGLPTMQLEEAAQAGGAQVPPVQLPVEQSDELRQYSPGVHVPSPAP